MTDEAFNATKYDAYAVARHLIKTVGLWNYLGIREARQEKKECEANAI